VGWGATRREVEKIRFEGGDLRHFEEPGLLKRVFHFRGDGPSITKIENFLLRP
jgi:hypothetical protein